MPAEPLSPPAFAAAALLGALPAAAQQNNVMRFVPHANLTVLDPIWTTAYVTRNHGYMIYDTLFAVTQKGEIKPQMVDKWTTSKDGKTWTFTLRDGLSSTTASPSRARTDRLHQALGLARRDGRRAQQVRRQLGGGGREDLQAQPERALRHRARRAGQAVLQRALHHAGAHRRHAGQRADQGKHRLRPLRLQGRRVQAGREGGLHRSSLGTSRAASRWTALTGGKVANFERVEWVIIRDTQTQFNAIKTGEVDWVEQPAFEQISQLKANPDLKVEDFAVGGLGFIMRFNFLHKPFDNQKIRQAAMVAIGQEAFLKTQVGVPGLYRYCPSIYPCGGTYPATRPATSPAWRTRRRRRRC